MESLESIEKLTRDDLIKMLHNARNSYAVTLAKYELLKEENNSLTEKLNAISKYAAKHKIKIK
jgi:hypothetical protein